MFVNESEATALAEVIKVSKFDFYQKFTEERTTPDGFTTSLKSKENKKECIFLSGNKCSVYEARPSGCRTYPFWPQILIGESEWKVESKRCEGISMESSISVPHVPKSKILQNLVIHEVHKRGLGPNWNYDESNEYLCEAEESNPALISDFEDEFFSTHYSTVLYVDDEVRVVDSTFPDPSKQLDGDDSLIEPSEASLEANASDLTTFRRLEFVGSEGVNQSEVKILATPSSLPSQAKYIDYSYLSMPIHRFVASCGKHMMRSTLNHHNDQHDILCVAVIGAGGCALPMNLLKSVSTSSGAHHSSDTALAGSTLPRMRIDAIEPSKRILDIAQLYFGAEFANPPIQVNDAGEVEVVDNSALQSIDERRRSGLFPYMSGGREFLLHRQRQRCQHQSDTQNSLGEELVGEFSYDVLIVDACENSSLSASYPVKGSIPNSSRIPRAPPMSLLIDASLLLSSLRPSSACAAPSTTAAGAATSTVDSLNFSTDLVVPSEGSTGRQGGLLLMNILGTSKWATWVAATLSDSATAKGILCDGPMLVQLDSTGESTINGLNTADLYEHFIRNGSISDGAGKVHSAGGTPASDSSVICEKDDSEFTNLNNVEDENDPSWGNYILLMRREDRGGAETDCADIDTPSLARAQKLVELVSVAIHDERRLNGIDVANRIRILDLKRSVNC